MPFWLDRPDEEAIEIALAAERAGIEPAGRHRLARSLVERARPADAGDVASAARDSRRPARRGRRRARAHARFQAPADRRSCRPRLAVWVPAALDPGEQAHAQLAGQLAVYLGAPGYGEMFAELGFGALVDRARAGGVRRAELTTAIPIELVEQVAAVGTTAEITERIAAYLEAGADHVGVAPSTAEDPAGSGVFEALTREGVA
jgi:hypothetical protein